MTSHVESGPELNVSQEEARLIEIGFELASLESLKRFMDSEYDRIKTLRYNLGKNISVLEDERESLKQGQLILK